MTVAPATEVHLEPRAQCGVRGQGDAARRKAGILLHRALTADEAGVLFVNLLVKKFKLQTAVMADAGGKRFRCLRKMLQGEVQAPFPYA